MVTAKGNHETHFNINKGQRSFLITENQHDTQITMIKDRLGSASSLNRDAPYGMLPGPQVITAGSPALRALCLCPISEKLRYLGASLSKSGEYLFTLFIMASI